VPKHSGVSGHHCSLSLLALQGVAHGEHARPAFQQPLRVHSRQGAQEALLLSASSILSSMSCQSSKVQLMPHTSAAQLGLQVMGVAWVHTALPMVMRCGAMSV